MGSSIAEHRQQVRQRMSGAMMRLIIERGYGSISLADVAAEAEVGRTAVYNHFTDKESVLLALIEDQTEGYLARLRAEMDAVGNPIDRLAVFVRMQLTELAGHHVHLVGLASALSEPGRIAVRRHVAPMVEILATILQEGIDQRYLPDDQDVADLVPLVSAAIAGRHASGLMGPALQHAVDTTVLFVLRGVGARLNAKGEPRRFAAPRRPPEQPIEPPPSGESSVGGSAPDASPADAPAVDGSPADRATAD